VKREDQLALKKAEYAGTIFKTNNYGDVVVVEYINSSLVKIRFINTNHVKEEYLSSVSSGCVRDDSIPSTCGVGYIDIEGASIGKNMTSWYSAWNAMITRCYNENLRHRHTSYKDCYVSEEWLYLSNFKDWCEKQIGFNKEGFHLDKDVLAKGKKVYSPETCCFIPKDINCALTNNKSVRGQFPQGVIYNCTKTRYRARIQRGNKWESLGTYDTPEEAFYAYKPVKETYIKSLAEKWKDQIDPRVYDALMKWEINIDD
jgi:hypothetical protein